VSATSRVALRARNSRHGSHAQPRILDEQLPDGIREGAVGNRSADAFRHMSARLDRGLGLGYTARAALESDRVSKCEVVEFLPQVISWLDRGLVPLSDELDADNRLKVIQGDVYRQLTSPPKQKQDLILIDVDHSPDENLDEANGNFYTADGLKRAKLHLAEDGLLGVWSYAESSPFADALRDVFREVRIEPVTVYNNLINVQQTDWLFFARD